ncbi:MAG: hypothetical protein J6Y48_20975 [Clostridia bacterium]|nr:hypothetical protein [Clostridia bacterium]
MRGFIPHSNEDGRVPPWKYLPCSAIQPTIGMALVQTSGNLAIATGTTKPTHISMVEADATLTAGDLIPVIEVQPDQVFECTNSAALTSVNIGQKVTLHASNGCQITATTSSGVARLVAKEADAIGSKCLVKFD